MGANVLPLALIKIPPFIWEQVKAIHWRGVKKRTLTFEKIYEVFKTLGISNQSNNYFSQNSI
jgi:hypothetical protein